MFSCRIKDRNNFTFVLEEPLEMPDPFENREFRLLQYRGDDLRNPDNWSSRSLGSDVKIFHGYVTNPSNNWLFTTYWGGVLRTGDNVMDKDHSDLEQDIPPNPGMETVFIRKAKVIDGKMYAFAMGRSANRRDAPDRWTLFNNGLPAPGPRKDGKRAGFRDGDGFSENDIYGGGFDGDVWHWDGQIWKKVAIPTNADIASVFCAGDGLVYMCTGVETFVVGRGNRWKIVSYRHERSLQGVRFRNLVWFKDRVYMGYGSTLYEIKDGKFQRSKLNDLEGRPVDWSYLDVREGLMLAGSKLEVALFDGERFETVIPFEIGG
jgi:hypothetical protein